MKVKISASVVKHEHLGHVVWLNDGLDVRVQSSLYSLHVDVLIVQFHQPRNHVIGHVVFFYRVHALATMIGR